MLRHASFAARTPQVVANGLARLLRARALRALNPPFPPGSWFVCLGDAQGTLLEVLPWGRVIEKNAAGGIGIDEAMRDRTSTHFLLQTPLSTTQIETIAAEEGWECARMNAGLFQFTKVWVGGTFLVELMSPERAGASTATFGLEGVAALDGRLRALERAIAESRSVGAGA